MLMTVFGAVPLYVLLTGGSPSVLRAGLMTMLGLLAARMNKLKDGLHLIAAAAVLMLAWNPYYIEDVSFQLSFLVTAGLIVGVSPFRAALPQGTRWKGLYDLLAVTIVAQLISFPVSIYYFNQFHLLSLMANLVLVPFISFIVMPIGGGALILGAAWPLGGKVLALLSVYANDITFWLVHRMSSAEPLRTIWASPSFGWIALWYIVIGLLFWLLAAAASSRRAQAAFAHDEEETRPSDPSTGSGALFIKQASARPAAGKPYQALTAEGELVTPSVRQSLLAMEAGMAVFDQAAPSLAEYDISMLDEQTAARRRKLYNAGIATAAAAAAALLLWAYFPGGSRGEGQVDILDVGQGDSIFVQTASGKHILIDGGGTVTFRKAGEQWKERSDPFEVGKDVVAPLLMKRGVHQLDLLVITHLDTDHIGGLKAVLDTIPVKRILWNGSIKENQEAVRLLRQAIGRSIPLYAAQAGQQWQADGQTSLAVLWPLPPEEEEGSRTVPTINEQNGDSVVIALQLNGRSFLLPGDIGSQEEHLLLESLQNRPSGFLSQFGEKGGGEGGRRVDVLKLAHHGSKNSTSMEWLRYWHPAEAAASAGLHNSYGHPNEETLERLQEAGVEVRRTDLQGEIQFKTDGEGLFVRTVK
ncbi:ComEC/Rec2 family competence protein [Paenibacillus protaetiae]|uniref:ComEC/Rec2 family competence protein n=1 Tax=Paenibacillus protaetiae TaxID=2509456 RepID=A0A4P6EVZ2_9BACL|nr:ComEC/Rec2 family competence protein [Paenibacillus protaetiae]QAY66343.1 ComEC/Rec2 family competence protein [Paenibacillus protaetiae]